MKTSSALLIFISSWCSAYGCLLEKCRFSQFQTCAGWSDNSCRTKTALNFAAKDLSGFVPSAFYSLIGTTINGNKDDGIPKVNVKQVLLQGNSIITGVEHIFDCPTIQEINLESNPIQSTGIKIKTTTALQTLNLKGTLQTDVKWLDGKTPNLKTLNLANNKISDLLPLAKMTKLTTLDLTGNPNIADLTALTSLTSLKSLKVDARLKKQADIIVSGGNPETKRGALVAVSVADSIGAVKTLVTANTGKITQLSSSVDTRVAALTAKNQALEAKLTDLTNKLNQINKACFAAPGPSRRLSDTGCLKSGDAGAVVSDDATMTSLVSAAAVVVMAMFL